MALDGLTNRRATPTHPDYSLQMQNASVKQADAVVRHSRAPALQFGPFTLRRAEKQLLENDRPVRLGSRAFELLTALAERAGEVVSREELEARVWPHTLVEETSLRVHISALRKALGDGRDGVRYITNVPGRGYCFTLPVAAAPGHTPESPSWLAAGTTHEAASHHLPARLTRAIGRSEVTAALGLQLARRRLVSIVGPGGMGKTTVALAVAHERLADYEHGAWFVDLAPLSDPTLVPVVLASVLGTRVPADDPWPALRAYLRDTRMLIVLDNCEHVIGAAAVLVEQILQAAPAIHILTTSREPLDAEGEWVHRLPSLDLPAVSDTLDVEQALVFPAIELFVERATASADGFTLSAATLPVIRHLCRHLDGMPLAIELAAARVESLGLKGLAARLDDLFRLLTRGRRTALPRHRTLQALIDWSHDLLTETERVVLRRLSVFRSGFTLASAGCVATFERIAAPAVMESVMALCAKSLLVIDSSGDTIRHRLLYTTRTYAMNKLAESGEKQALARRHAQHFRELLEEAGQEREDMPIAQWLGKYAHTMDDVRAGLDWAFSPDGDPLIGVSLAAAAIHLAFELGLNDEYRPRIDLALEVVRTMTPSQPELELRLCSALFFMVGVTAGRSDPDSEVLARTMELANQLGSTRYKVEAMFGLCLIEFRHADYPPVLAWAERIRALGADASEPLAVGHHYLGDHRSSARLARQVLQSPSASYSRQYLGYVPRTVTMRYLLARIAWLEGRSDEAVRLAHECVDHAAGAHPLGLSQALRTAITIALWRGDNARARELVDRQETHAIRHSQSSELSSVRNFRQVLASCVNPQSGATGSAMQGWMPTTHMGELDALGTFSQRMVLPATLARAERGLVGWCAPEILRAHAENLLRSGEADVVAAEAIFMRSLQLARMQGALSWELRSAGSLARMWQSQKRVADARGLLAATYERFTEGFETADLIEAKRLLADLQVQPMHTERHRA